jgi:hypothetical protein
MAFTQRQAAGKFTRSEAESLIERLQDAEFRDGPPVASEPSTRLSTVERAMRRLPTDQLATELRRRGWTVIEP